MMSQGPCKWIVERRDGDVWIIVAQTITQELALDVIRVVGARIQGEYRTRQHCHIGDRLQEWCASI